MQAKWYQALFFKLRSWSNRLSKELAPGQPRIVILGDAVEPGIQTAKVMPSERVDTNCKTFAHNPQGLVKK